MSGESEVLLRLSIFAGVLILLAGLEVLWPRRAVPGRVIRWPANAALSVLNSVLTRLIFLVVPGLTVLAAVYGEGQGFGVLPLLGLTGFVAGLVGFILLDLAIYLQHVAFHYVPAFWMVHQVHHSDTEFDVTTGIRFHPVEIIFSLLWKIAVVLVLGVPAVAVLIFEIALNATSMFSHANVRLPLWFDRLVRRVTVTPDMHRIHHSIAMDETNSNFGFNLSLWDRLFSTYRESAAGNQETMLIGLASYRGVRTAQLFWLLKFPFARGPSA